MGCLECGKELTQTPGKRAKQFCNVTCRSNYWQKQKRKDKPQKKGVAGRPIKKNTGIQNTDMVLPGPIGDLKFTDGSSREIIQTKSDFKKGSITLTLADRKVAKELASKIDFMPTTSESYDAEKFNHYIHDEPPIYQKVEVVSSELKLPTDPMELKRMAEAGVPDLVAFKKHVASIKMTAGQRAMIYSKLKLKL